MQRRRTLSRDVTMIINRLPSNETECRRVRHLVFRDADDPITEDQLLEVLPLCIRMESIILCGVRDVTDRTVLLASTLTDLQGLDLSGCIGVTDVGILELTKGLQSLQWLRLSAIAGLTDASISAIAKSCPRLTELELSHLPLLTAVSVRDLWTYLRQLKTLKLESCPLLTDRGFPSILHSAEVSTSADKPLPPLPEPESLPPLHLTHTAENLRELDLRYCPNMTDGAVAGIVAHAPMLQTLMLSGCTRLTDRAIDNLCRLGDRLDVLTLAHLSNVTDRAIVKLARSCTNLRTLNIDFCRQLTDMTVFEVASLTHLRKLSFVRVQKLTDIAIFALAEHTKALESLNISYCDRLSLDAVHLLLKRVETLHHLEATGVPSFRRKGIKRFSDTAPNDFDVFQQAAHRVFSGENITGLRAFLDKEERRRQAAESQNVKFVPRADDKLDL